MNRTAGKIWNAVGTALVVLVVLLAALLVGVRIAGLKTYTVLSGSMEPAYPTGALLYVKGRDPQDLRVGDPITFMLDESTVVTHRILEILPDEEAVDTFRFRTKGDANDTSDGNLVHGRNIIGKPVLRFPILDISHTLYSGRRGYILRSGLRVFRFSLSFCPAFSKRAKGRRGERVP